MDHVRPTLIFNKSRATPTQAATEFGLAQPQLVYTNFDYLQVYYYITLHVYHTTTLHSFILSRCLYILHSTYTCQCIGSISEYYNLLQVHFIVVH